MNFNELQAILQNLTNKKISLAEIGRIDIIELANSLGIKVYSTGEINVPNIKN